jgi:hypothetical protein
MDMNTDTDKDKDTNTDMDKETGIQRYGYQIKDVGKKKSIRYLTYSGSVHSPVRYQKLRCLAQSDIRMSARLCLKGTVSRDFLTLVFFIKQLLLVPLDMPKKDFEFF